MSNKKFYGLYQGVVTKVKDPEKRGRIKVKCPEVLGGDVESAWCDPMIPVAYDYGGDFYIPVVNEAVWIQFIAGDSNRPVYMGGWWSEKKSPLGSSYESINKVRIINYADCTITMRDGKIDINVGEGTYDLRIQDGKVTVNGNLTVNGAISAYSVSAGNIHAVSSENGGGVVKADTRVDAPNV